MFSFNRNLKDAIAVQDLKGIHAWNFFWCPPNQNSGAAPVYSIYTVYLCCHLCPLPPKNFFTWRTPWLIVILKNWSFFWKHKSLQLSWSTDHSIIHSTYCKCAPHGPQWYTRVTPAVLGTSASIHVVPVLHSKPQPSLYS